MRKAIYLLISVVLLSACHLNRADDDLLSGKELRVFRYDRLQYEAVALGSVSALQRMRLECSQATRLLAEDVLAIGNADTDDMGRRLCEYYSDTTLIHLMEDALLKFSDMSDIEKGLTKGFARLKKEIPSLVVPAVYSQISALNQSVVVGDSLLGFSIDKYMGEDYPLYKRYYYDHQRRTMTPERILPDCFTSYLFSQYPYHWRIGARSLYDIILHRGKVFWTVAHIGVADSETELLGYDKEQISWCKKNGKKFWRWMQDQRLLDSTDPMVIRAFTHSDPASIFGQEQVPPMIGVWYGMQLVDKYMKDHPKTTLDELLSCDDFGIISLDK